MRSSATLAVVADVTASGAGLAAAQLIIRSPGPGGTRACPLDEITWLDRQLLSAGSDDTLHRAPRCAGVCYLDHGWELFSRDTTHEVFVRPYAGGPLPSCEQVQASATHVLPVARDRFEPYPLRLDNGSWLVSVGRWVLVLHVEGTGRRSGGAAAPGKGTATHEYRRAGDPGARGRRAQPLPGAAPAVRAYFARKTAARLAIAYYYQEFILGAVSPLPMPMSEVAVALDLTGDAAVSEYKKELQRLIWNEQGHQRELAGFLIANGLLSTADVELAGRTAAANQRSGRTSTARARLRYRQKKGHGRGAAAPPGVSRAQQGSGPSNGVA
jgi:hypothetical protein